MLTKGSVTQDEWNHLVRLLIIMIAQHALAAIPVIFFLILQGTRKPCQREAQKELPATAHRWQSQRQAKARPVNLVSHSSHVQLSARSSFGQDLSSPENSENATTNVSSVCTRRRELWRSHLLVARDVEKACQKQLNETQKQKWAFEKPKVDNARRLRGIYFIDPADAEFKEAI